MKGQTIWFLILIFLSLPFASSDAAAGAITIAGDPCSVPLATKLAEAYRLQNKGFEAEVSTFSCTLGVFKAADGEVDLGVSTQNGLSSNLPKGAVNTVIAKSPIVLVVNKSNPVNNLTYDQLKGILSGSIKNWKEVGGKDLEIKNIMLEPCVRHTISKQVTPYAKDLSELRPDKAGNPVEYTNKLVSENESAIGQQIYGYESNDVKVLPIDGVLPDEITIPAKYTFYQDYNMVTQGKPAGAIKDFIEFSRSAEEKKIIESMRHIPAEQ